MTDGSQENLIEHTTVATLPNRQDLEIKSAEYIDVMGLNLEIPEYQRAYCWGDLEISRFWRRLIENYDKKALTYDINWKLHMGSIILQEKAENTKRDPENKGVCALEECSSTSVTRKYEIVDGQQRLVTLALIMKEMNIDEAQHIPLLHREVKDKDSITYLKNALYLIEAYVRPYKASKHSLNFVDFLKHSLTFTVIISSNNPDLAFIFFNNENSGGVKLNDYNLLKAHHLRFLPREKESLTNHVATKWDNLSMENDKGRDKKQKLEKFLGGYLYSLRKLTRKELESPTANCVLDEFQAARIMDDLLPYTGDLYYNESIQGGERFFSYVDKFKMEYARFTSTDQIKQLRYRFSAEQQYYTDIIESLLFAYYLKFGEQYLAEAIFCICVAFAEHRYSKPRALQSSILEYANESNLLQMIERAPSPAFFIAEALAMFPRAFKDFEDNKGAPITGVRERFNKKLHKLFYEDMLKDISEQKIKDKITNGYF